MVEKPSRPFMGHGTNPAPFQQISPEGCTPSAKDRRNNQHNPQSFPEKHLPKHAQARQEGPVARHSL